MFNKKVGYLLLILIIFIVLVIPDTRKVVYRVSGDFLYPFVSMVYNLESFVDKKADLRKSKTVLIDEIVDLRRKNTLLAAKSKQVDLLRRENNELHQLLSLKNNPFYNYVFAEIISRDPVQWFQQFTINKGLKDGVENGSLVVARIKSENKRSENIEFAVVGRISAISNHTAIVDTIINQDCRLSVIIPGNGATGILKGGGRNGTELWSQIEYLPRDLKYKTNSVVQTSGLNNFIPPALKVGKVAGAERNPAVTIYNDLYASVKITPYIDFNHLKFVLILVKND